MREPVRARFRHTLAHPCQRPARGPRLVAPIWPVLRGDGHLTLSLLTCSDPVDSGDVFRKEQVPLDGAETFDELNAKLFEAEVRLMSWAVENCDRVTPQPQSGEPSHWPRRTPEDGRIRPDAPFSEVFTLLRVSDPFRYPAFYDYRGQRFRIRVEKVGPVDEIEQREIGPGCRPYLIAEMSGNHNQSLERALEIVDAAADSGADAVKLQTYTADTMTLDLDRPDFVINDPKSLWTGAASTICTRRRNPWDWHAPIMERARSRGMHCFSTPFDFTAVDFLESLDVPAYKIASFEKTDLPLIERSPRPGSR